MKQSDDMTNIPYFVMEGVVDRLQKQIKQMWALSILLICLLVTTNVCWLVYESKFEKVVTTQEVQQSIESADNSDLTIMGICNIDGEDETDSKDNDY